MTKDLRLGLKKSDIEIIKKIINKFPEIKTTKILELSRALNEESPLPYKFDIFEYFSSKESSIKEHVDEHGIEL